MIFLNNILILSLNFYLTKSTFIRSSNQIESFDYLVIGGGTAGLTLASRLAESDSSISVCVIEAGNSSLNNPQVTIPGFFGSSFRSQIDWNYSTIHLPNANSRSIIYPRGKCLGGTSALNFMIATKSSKFDYDSIEKLGNPGWGWETFDRGIRKSEKLIILNQTMHFDFSGPNHGQNGNTKLTFPKYLTKLWKNYFDSSKILNHNPSPLDTFDGQINGPWIYPSTIDENSRRVTSETGYLNQPMSNLIIKSNSEVKRLITKKASNGKITIKGVELKSDSIKHQKLIYANKEVISSAGSIGTPKILEQSGIGEKKILSKLKIPTILNLPGVGNNLIDHPLIWNVYELSPNVTSLDELLTNSTFATEQFDLYQSKREGVLTSALNVIDFEDLNGFLNQDEIKEGLQIIQDHKNMGNVVNGKAFDVVLNLLKNGTPMEFILDDRKSLEMKAVVGKHYMSIVIVLQYPLSRGSTHITSKDANRSPAIDNGFLNHPFDLWLLSKASNHSRSITNQNTWNPIIKQEHLPSLKVQSLNDFQDYVRSSVGTIYHPIGTASMLPYKDNGVVDPDLKVYGTNNLRVVDASILPIHLAMHPQMTIYAIGEIGAEKVLQSSSR